MDWKKNLHMDVVKKKMNSFGEGISEFNKQVKVKVGGERKPRQFGVDLDPYATELPFVLEKTVNYFYAVGVEQEGIFRLSGSHDKIQALRKAFDRGDNVDLTDPDIDYNCVSGLLKQYLRELPEPLLSFELYDCFLAAVAVPTDTDGTEHMVKTVKKTLGFLPVGIMMVVKFLMKFLHFVTQHADQNKMTPSNMAIVFSPTLLRPQEDDLAAVLEDTPFSNKLVELLLTNYEFLFEKPKNNRKSMDERASKKLQAMSRARQSVYHLTQNISSFHKQIEAAGEDEDRPIPIRPIKPLPQSPPHAPPQPHGPPPDSTTRGGSGSGSGSGSNSPRRPTPPLSFRPGDRGPGPISSPGVHINTAVRRAPNQRRPSSIDGGTPFRAASPAQANPARSAKPRFGGAGGGAMILPRTESPASTSGSGSGGSGVLAARKMFERPASMDGTVTKGKAKSTKPVVSAKSAITGPPRVWPPPAPAVAAAKPGNRRESGEITFGSAYKKPPPPSVMGRPQLSSPAAKAAAAKSKASRYLVPETDDDLTKSRHRSASAPPPPDEDGGAAGRARPLPTRPGGGSYIPPTKGAPRPTGYKAKKPSTALRDSVFRFEKDGAS
eukprot:TRINITY_DN2527_c0_g1_i1.p1 TRINITY_DN2527_c0_g1~~TRINITY_DN2527_c0_g1_i1.p1  ORF type:complete len:606 (+),score=131.74 TRINITY_DN2527_c0_g1_i1:253-2070(+)